MSIVSNAITHMCECVRKHTNPVTSQIGTDVVFTTASEDFSTTILVQRINVSKNCVGIVECVKTEETRTYKSRSSLSIITLSLSLSRSPHAFSLSLSLSLALTLK